MARGARVAGGDRESRLVTELQRAAVEIAQLRDRLIDLYTEDRVDLDEFHRLARPVATETRRLTRLLVGKRS